MLRAVCAVCAVLVCVCLDLSVCLLSLCLDVAEGRAFDVVSKTTAGCSEGYEGFCTGLCWSFV